MGTTFAVKVVTQGLSEDQQEEIQRAIESELEMVNAKMSNYLPSSELSRFNRRRDTAPFALSAETIEVLAEAARISEATGGAFDITVGPLVDAWGFGPSKWEQTAPSDDELRRLRDQLGWNRIKVDAAESRVRKLNPEIECDLSAIAKGYAVDRVSEALRAAGYGNHMVELGGEIRTAGKAAESRRWRIAVERPLSAQRGIQRVLPLGDVAMATSGDYRNFYERDGVRLSHTIDPRTGRPVLHRLASVSVIDASCMRADGYATALMVMGDKEGPRFAAEQGLAALFLIRGEGSELVEQTTPAFETLFGEAADGRGGET
jgi:thiamine biosynthesis lipoprotein